ncbi:hypothetical protein BDN72DRAFT_849745 [Pluteus cervinus]|uniref:Uncharacterized protein n=1 Tax=Pluteus cervinus TaxID=181527 RepID=A0ACD3A6M2_9AGAR|nr:hypothetical protein BDN72DRAFT_849745 [Pluteus cervinus]
MPKPVPSPKGKRVLAIDGGGFRGLGQLLVIEAITNAADKIYRGPTPTATPLKPSDIFDITVGASTGGFIAILLSTFKLDCKTAIAEYKALGTALFGTDRAKFLETLTGNPGQLPSAAYVSAIESLVAKYATNKDSAWYDSSAPQTAVTTIPINWAVPQKTLTKSWVKPPPPWKIRELIHQTTAASPAYLPTVQVGSKKYVDSAYEPSWIVNPTRVAQELWKPDQIGVVVNIGQSFVQNEVYEYTNSTNYPLGPETRERVKDFLNGYAVPAADAKDREGKAFEVVKRILRQGLKIKDVNQAMANDLKDAYVRVDPPLGIGSLELVDIFEADKVEQAVAQFLNTLEGQAGINLIAKRLVVDLKTTDPTTIIPPPPDGDTREPNQTVTEPRPKDINEWLKKFQVIFVVDDSSSMVLSEDYSRNDEARWTEASEALSGIAQTAYDLKVATVELCFLNSLQHYKNVQGSSTLLQYMAANKPPTHHGNPRLGINYTPTGACLQRVLNRALQQLDSLADTPEAYQAIPPFDIILLTDGEADDQPTPVLEAAWRRLRANRHHPNYINVQVIQIGNSAKAAPVLLSMMNGNIGNMVHTTPWKDVGRLNTEKLKNIILGQLQPNVRTLLQQIGK